MKKKTLEEFSEMIKNYNVYHILQLIKTHKENISLNYSVSYEDDYGGTYGLNMSITVNKKLYQYTGYGIACIDLCYRRIAYILYLWNALKDYRLCEGMNKAMKNDL